MIVERDFREARHRPANNTNNSGQQHERHTREHPPAARRRGRRWWLLDGPGQRGLHVERVLKSAIGIFRQTGPDHALQRRGETERRRLALEDRRNHARRGLPVERAPAREHLVQHAPEAEDVAARVGVFAVQLLRRHVLQRAENLSFGRQSRRQRGVDIRQRAARRGQSEIEQLDALFS
jgi:hypothetical protein